MRSWPNEGLSGQKTNKELVITLLDLITRQRFGETVFIKEEI
jgi:hypothetical protein